MRLPKPIYLDNHATTRVDPRVVEAMLPYWTEAYGNAASATHWFGQSAKVAVEAARESIAAAIGAKPREIVFTSGATESNNLAIRGVADRPDRRGNHLVSVATEHPSVLEPLAKLSQRGFDVTLLPTVQAPDPQAGRILPEQVAEALRAETILVSVMLANHEIGAIQPLEEIGRICKSRGVLLHTDATQALGKIPVDVQRLGVDLMSFSAHKLYGPKGIGALYVRQRHPRVRLEPLLYGGGHEGGLRSGTANVPGIIGFARAVALCMEEMPTEGDRVRSLRNRLFQRLTGAVTGISLNGPALVPDDWRLPGNLNLTIEGVEAETLLLSVEGLAASVGSACSSAHPGPSHVLRALGLSESAARGSVRFGLGRFNTAEEVDMVVSALAEVIDYLRQMAIRPWQAEG